VIYRVQRKRQSARRTTLALAGSVSITRNRRPHKYPTAPLLVAVFLLPSSTTVGRRREFTRPSAIYVGCCPFLALISKVERGLCAIARSGSDIHALKLPRSPRFVVAATRPACARIACVQCCACYLRPGATVWQRERLSVWHCLLRRLGAASRRLKMEASCRRHRPRQEHYRAGSSWYSQPGLVPSGLLKAPSSIRLPTCCWTGWLAPEDPQVASTLRPDPGPQRGNLLR